jgi:hypothetical protein
MRTDMVTREEMVRHFNAMVRMVSAVFNGHSEMESFESFIGSDGWKERESAIRALLTAPTFEVECPSCRGGASYRAAQKIGGVILGLYSPCPRCVNGKITVVEVKEK